MSISLEYGDASQQRELFLLKFPDIDRVDVIDMFEAFQKYDTTGAGEVDEYCIQLMMADLGVHKTLIELRSMLSTIDFSQGKKIQFLELCCASFGKDLAVITDHTDAAAVANAKLAAEAAQAIQDEIIRRRQKEEQDAEELAQKLEEESQLNGVAAMKAFYHRAAEAVPDQTMTNAERIKQEAAMRKAKKEAEKALKAAELEMKQKNKSDADIRAEVNAMAQKLKDEADAAAAAAVEAERTERAARKAAFNAKFGGGK